MSHVPLYVYPLFLALMYWGYKCCFLRIMRLERLVLFPAVCIVLSLRTVLNLFHMGWIGAGFWIAGVALGLLPGYLYASNKAIRADRKQKLIAVPGDWAMLVLIFLIFTFEFFMHYSMEAQWDISKLFAFKAASECMLGFIAGMATGRNFTYGYRYSTAQNENLLATA